MGEALLGFVLFTGWLVLLAVTSFLWTYVKVSTDIRMTKHKKVCDICFRDIKRWHEFNNEPETKEDS